MNVVVLGATSGIAMEMQRLYAARNCSLALLARNATELAALKADLLVRGATSVETIALDLAAPASCEDTLQEISTKLGGIDVLVLAYGILGDQAQARHDLLKAAEILNTDFTSAALWLLAAAKVVRSTGTIAVFGSVAGDRGRKSNFIYGAAKGGLALIAQGLAHDLARSGPNIVVFKPGFVDTAMTAQFKKGGPLWASAKDAARMTVRAIDDKRGPIVYVPWFWRWIMLIIRLVPARIFHRTEL